MVSVVLMELDGHSFWQLPLTDYPETSETYEYYQWGVEYRETQISVGEEREIQYPDSISAVFTAVAAAT